MKRAFWGMLVVACLPASVGADDGAPIPWANKFFVPKDPPSVIVHDFGTVPSGTTLTHRFELANIYAVPMQIVKDPEVSCGCTRILRYTQRLEAREKGYIEVEMDGRRFQGAKTVTIQVRFGPEFRSTANLQVARLARTDVSINPGQVAFGTVAVGQQPAQAIDIKYTGQQANWQIAAVDDANASNVKTTLQRSQAGSYRLTVSLRADAEPGVLQDQILLKTNDANSPVIAIPVAAVVQAPLTVSPSPLRLDPIAVGGDVSRNVRIRGNKPFKITKVDGEGEGLSVRYVPIPNSPIQNVTISFKPTQAGQLNRKLTFTTDLKESVSMSIEGTAETPTP